MENRKNEFKEPPEGFFMRSALGHSFNYFVQELVKGINEADPSETDNKEKYKFETFGSPFNWEKYMHLDDRPFIEVLGRRARDVGFLIRTLPTFKRKSKRLLEKT
jgi:hypothetical protein